MQTHKHGQLSRDSCYFLQNLKLPPLITRLVGMDQQHIQLRDIDATANSGHDFRLNCRKVFVSLGAMLVTAVLGVAWFMLFAIGLYWWFEPNRQPLEYEYITFGFTHVVTSIVCFALGVKIMFRLRTYLFRTSN